MIIVYKSKIKLDLCQGKMGAAVKGNVCVLERLVTGRVLPLVLPSGTH